MFVLISEYSPSPPKITVQSVSLVVVLCLPYGFKSTHSTTNIWWVAYLNLKLYKPKVTFPKRI